MKFNIFGTIEDACAVCTATVSKSEQQKLDYDAEKGTWSRVHWSCYVKVRKEYGHGCE